MTTYIAALRRRKENGDAGFSLIELIVVVVILGVLAAIAVPVFLGLQGQAEDSAANSAIANGASQVASDLAQGKAFGTSTDAAAADTAYGNLVDLMADAGFTVTLTGAGLEDFCVTPGSDAPTGAVASGPGC